jgi:hypothetical protein
MAAPPAVPSSPLARLAFAGLALSWMVAGWWTLLAGGWGHRAGRFGPDVSWVTGTPAAIGALLLVALGAIAAAVLLQSLGCGRRARATAIAALWLPALVWALLRGPAAGA